VIVTSVPAGPDCGDRLLIDGGGVTVNVPATVGTPLIVRTTSPVVAPLGTVTVMLVSLQETAIPASTPLNVTVLVSCVAPK
jgi:hypothetical protein